jgi:hypothetical protein
MYDVFWILLLAAFVLGVILGVLLMVVIGIRSTSRYQHLYELPSTRAEAASRRLLGSGVTTPPAYSDDDDEGE